MTKTLTGKQVLALLAQDEVPDIEQQTVGNWMPLADVAWHPLDLRNTSTVFRIKPTPPQRLSSTLYSGEVVSWPKPIDMRETLKDRQEYWYVDEDGSISRNEWWGYYTDFRRLAFGNVHLTKEAAQEHADALRKINTQEATC